MEFLTQQIDTRNKDIEVLKSRLAVESNQLNGIGEDISEIYAQTKLIVQPKNKGEMGDGNIDDKEQDGTVNLNM